MHFQAYHGATASQHQTNFDKWSEQGYRMISLSVYGDAGNPRYAAVWVQRAGPAYAAVHGVDANGYQAFFTKWSKAGYHPVLVSATGEIGDAVFAAVFEQGDPGPWLGRHGMTSADFTTANTSAAAQQQILRSFTIYGSSSDRRYAAIWLPNPTFVKSHIHATDSASDYQTNFNAETQLPGVTLNAWRPAYVALSRDATYCSVFKDDWVGPWIARHGLSASDYQSVLRQGGCAGVSIRSWCKAEARREARSSRRSSPSRTSPTSGNGPCRGHRFPRSRRSIRPHRPICKPTASAPAQVAILKGGVVKASRGYTWAEPAYRDTQPSDRFLLASCSKMFLEGAIQSLYNSGKLEPPKLTVKPNGGEKPAVGDTVTGNTSGATAIVTAVNGNVLTLVSVLKVFTTADNAATMSNSGGTVAVVAYDPGTKVYPLLGFSHPADCAQRLDHDSDAARPSGRIQ